MEIVLQDGIKDCGVCCLLSIIKHYHGNVSKERLRQWTNTDKTGVSAYKLVETAEKVGFSAYGAKGGIKDLKEETFPVIAHTIINKTYHHFIVIYDIDYEKEKLLIMDPAKGKKTLSFASFNLMSSGVFILLTPAKNIIHINSENQVKTLLFSFLTKHKKYLPFLFSLTILINIMTIIITYHFKYLQEEAINYSLTNNILFISAFIFIMYLIKESCSLLKNNILVKFSTMLDEEIMYSTFKQIILLPYLYYKNRTSGEILSRIKDLNIVKEFIAKAISFLISDLLFIVVFTILLFNINYQLAVITIISLGLISISTIFFRNYITPSIKKYYKDLAIVNSNLVESISSPNAIKSMHLEKLIIDKFKIKYQKFLTDAYSIYQKEEQEKSVKNIIYGIFNILILGIGSKLVIEKEIILGEFIIFQSLLNNILYSFNNLVGLYTDYKAYKLAKERIEDLYTIKNEIFDGSIYYQNYSLLGTIKFKNFSYSYNNQELLKDINLSIKKGDKILLKGSSGSGKSTFVKSLMRYIDVPYGQITINSIDINHYHLNTIRDGIIYVSNNEYLFTDTLLENIKLYKNYDSEEINKICKLTKVDEIVKKDNAGFNQIVEENGYNMSTGEKQRIILARTLLKKSDIYIFDETFNGIDKVKCEQIMKGIFEFLKDKTVIVVSHRLNNDFFNRVLLLKNHHLYEEKVSR
ncbi:MAG: peptidase domain-containing ABC transporter [Bacilli bacterium]|nr:peptidase domain-containing ABC transporter [Bacilli bacterium]